MKKGAAKSLRQEASAAAGQENARMDWEKTGEEQSRLVFEADPAQATPSEFCRVVIAKLKEEFKEREPTIDARITPNNFEFTVNFADEPADAKPLKITIRRLPDWPEEEYSDTRPPSQADDTSRLGMGDDFNTALAVSRYELLARRVDLLNPRLAEDERLRRAGHLLKSYERLRKVVPDFHDTGDELRAARRIQKAAYRERQRAKHGEGPAAVRGRPRKLAYI